MAWMTHGVKQTRNPFTVTSYLHLDSYHPANFDQMNTTLKRMKRGIVDRQQIHMKMIEPELSTKLALFHPCLWYQ
jgi:hypothetical protein